MINSITFTVYSGRWL